LRGGALSAVWHVGAQVLGHPLVSETVIPESLPPGFTAFERARSRAGIGRQRRGRGLLADAAQAIHLIIIVRLGEGGAASQEKSSRFDGGTILFQKGS
jgi:hypothetical protein